MALTQVSTSGIKDGSVSTADLADGSISTAKVADDAITADKLNNTGVTAGSYTLSSVTVDAQGRVTAASSGTPVDADKIIEGNTEVEAVDTGSDGHIKATTEGSERFRVGPAGQMGIGGANYGTSGQVFMSGGASAAPTWGDVSSSPTFEATASGALSDGDPCIIKSDGKVEKPGTIVTERSSYSGGSRQNPYSGGVNWPTVVWNESDNVLLIAYNDSSGSEGEMLRATPNTSDTYTFANTETVYTTDDALYNKLVYDSNAGKAVLFYRGTSSDGKARVVDSSNGLSFGTQATFNGGTVSFIDGVFDPDTNQIVIVYQDSTNLKARVGAVSGTSISFGTEVTIASGGEYPGIAYDTTNNKIVVSYVDSSNNDGKAVVGTVSGTSISFGTAVTWETPDNVGAGTRAVYHTEQEKIVIAYTNSSQTSKVYMIAGTVSGTSISFGTKLVAVSDNNVHENSIDLFYHSGTKRVLLAYGRPSGNESLLKGFSLSGTTLTATKSVEYRSAGNENNAIADFPDSERVHVVYRDGSHDSLMISPVEVASYGSSLTTDNYVGISNGAYSDGATATIQTFGAVDDAQSGLTAGEKYYVQGNGTLGTSQTQGTGTLAGIALSATKLLISGN